MGYARQFAGKLRRALPGTVVVNESITPGKYADSPANPFFGGAL